MFDFFKIIYIFIVFWAIAEIFIVWWMFRAKPKGDIMDKYSKCVSFHFQLPFVSSWRKDIRDEDIELIKRYRYRIRIWYLSVIIPAFSIFVYLFIYVLIE